MSQLEYEARGRWFSSGGEAVVLREDGSEAARVELTTGGFLRGPSWTWRGAFGPEWVLRSTGGRSYEVVRADGAPVGTIARRGWLSSAFDVRAADGATATVAPKRMLSRERSVTLPDGRTLACTRTTQGMGLLTSAESWTLDVPDDIDEPLFTLLLAVPLVLDHQHRRDQQAAG